MPYETPITIFEAIQNIHSNKYVLPSIQREFVWNEEQIEKLFDSIMQDYPIGAFLFWQLEGKQISGYEFYRFLDHYHARDNFHGTVVDLSGITNVTAILDGQQRLTSLYIGLKGSFASPKRYRPTEFPVKKLYLNLLSTSEKDDMKYDFKFLTAEDIVENDDCFWFEVGKILDMPDLGTVAEYITDNISYSDIHKFTKEQAKFATNTLSQLYHVIRDVLIINYYNEQAIDLNKVLNVFVRVNSGGKVLSHSDLLLSLATARWKDHDARQEITTFVDEINDIGDGFSVSKDFVLKAALTLSDCPVAFKLESFNKESTRKIEANWDNVKKAVRLAFRLIVSFGYSGKTLMSYNAVIPIAYYLEKINASDSFIDSGVYRDDRTKIKKWLIRSLLKQIFGGHSDSLLTKLREIIQNVDANEFPLQAIVDEYKGQSKSIEFTESDINEYLLKLEYGKPFTLSVLMLLYPSLDYNNKFHVDHIYPKSRFKKTQLRRKGLSESQIDEAMASCNNIANLQLLAARPNEEKSTTDFEDWFDCQCPTDSDKIQYRQIHYIPEIDYTYTNFTKFIQLRAEIMREKLIELLN